MTKTIQEMPDIWDDQKFTTSRKTVLGALANWAVQQSPYLVPDNLADALREFDSAFHSDEFFSTDCDWLKANIRLAFMSCPHIEAWNNSKKGDVQIAFYSRYDKPQPDYDFIDLDALARNVAHSCTLAEKYNQLHD